MTVSELIQEVEKTQDRLKSAKHGVVVGNENGPVGLDLIWKIVNEMKLLEKRLDQVENKFEGQ